MTPIRSARNVALALLLVAGLGGLTGWLATGGAGGATAASGGANLTFSWYPVNITCNAPPQRLSFYAFVEGPGGIFEMEHVISGTCGGAVHTNPDSITLNAAPAGTYQIGLEVLSGGGVSVSAVPTVSSTSGGSISAVPITGSGSGNVQALSTFVYRNRLFQAS